MDLTEKNKENIEWMITEMKEKLQLVNRDVLRSENFSVDQYDDLRDIYEWVMSKTSISISEMQAIVGELGNLRSK